MMDIFHKTVRHFFPELEKQIDSIPDPRHQPMVKYPLRFLFWEGILLFSLNLGSRRQIHNLLRTSPVATHINALAGTELEHTSHGDTLSNLLERVNHGYLVQIRTDMLRKLIRSRVFDKHRLLGKFYRVVIDGSGIRSYDYKHCDHCLTKKCDKENPEKITYYHMVLEAKLVADNGLALSIDTEFIENPGPNTTKQDCELKAFYRMAPRLKEAFPMLPICLLMDGLYANKTVMGFCKKFCWGYIISFMEGSMPVKYEEFESLCNSVQRENKIIVSLPDKTRQEYAFATDIEHEGHFFNAIRCVETKPDEEPKQFVWMTNLTVTKNICAEIANQGGRKRWIIENQGFNTQKNGGYNLEHAYSQNNNADKCFYLLLQIAHIIRQLMDKGSLLSEEVRKKIGSIKNIAYLLLENIRTVAISKVAYEALFASAFQIRLDSA